MKITYTIKLILTVFDKEKPKIWLIDKYLTAIIINIKYIQF